MVLLPVNDIAGLRQERFQYREDHELQTLTVYTPEKDDSSENLSNNLRIWIIYIHGGAWRDPLVDSSSFNPTIQNLFTSSKFSHLKPKIVSYASINYRLSAHPSFPQDPTSHNYRNAKHPDHLQDVCSALSFLESRYSMGDRYMLVGHSCGATLAMQVIMGQEYLLSLGVPSESLQFKLPRHILGVAGIYDLQLLRDRNTHPAYNEFLIGAFGVDEKVWDAVSPAKFAGYTESLENGKTLAFATSMNDQLVDESQIDVMVKRVEELGNGVVLKNYKNALKEGHDDVWNKGELANVLATFLDNC
ncbi:kynurenine formamidase protein [Rutstroemia sp. NJR-2017a WRK4]|nr:kynurenine formamidase protein [Rutstroemia sp. NJR-2017a WRK4]